MIKNALRVLMATCLLASVTMIGADRAAAAVGPLRCQAAATAVFVEDPLTGVTSWTIDGKGSCANEVTTFFLDFQGSGSSLGLGACTTSGPNAGRVSNLNIPITGTLVSSTTGLPRPLVQNWHASETTFPVMTPFLIGNNGTGLLFTHIFAQCPPAGTPSAFVTFEFPS